ncbi:MAG: dihydrodipicolinate synthase family protein [Candidatus Bathyarchaeia archaeon]
MEAEKLREYFMRGVVQVVQLTPFKDNDEIDYDGLKENTSFLVEKRDLGPMLLTPVGSTGEKYAVNDEEWKRIVKTVVDTVDGKIPVVVGASHSGTSVAIQRARYAEDVGADGVLVVLPYYHVPEEEGLYRHYKAIADSVNIGVEIYNNPSVSKIYMKPHILKRIVENTKNIVAVKENGPFPATWHDEIRMVGDKVAILMGSGELFFAMNVVLNFKGFVSGYANFMPEFCIDLLKAGLNKDIGKLETIIRKLDYYEDFVAKMCNKYGPTTTILPYPYDSSYMVFGVDKAAMDIVGLTGGHMRLPLLDIGKEDKKELESILFDKLQLKKVR